MEIDDDESGAENVMFCCYDFREERKVLRNIKKGRKNHRKVLGESKKQKHKLGEWCNIECDMEALANKQKTQH